ncbi:MAG: DEAD/DEAH box helicase family protein [Elusimicrobia bacterium]|nr:DEAD/DEAH box helicase family protein [Elusimicrobiota bacterium]
MEPEEKARQNIDKLLKAAGWEIQDLNDLNLSAARGVAIREFPLKSGEADYLLFVDKMVMGVIEAKPEGTPLGGTAEQSRKYLSGIPDNLPRINEVPPFAYESTGVETHFRDIRDPDFRSRKTFAFHKPETLKELAESRETLRTRLKTLPPLITDKLWPAQIEAITNLEKSLAHGHPRALIQMATGSGKTFTAINFIYRLIKHAGARRVLFLVDRSNLGRQTFKEFSNFAAPDDGRLFTSLYNVQHLRSNKIDPVAKVTITTIQRLFSMLKGDAEFDENLEEESLLEHGLTGQPAEIGYNPNIPLETFDFIVTDECHRSIYNLWRQVLEYYDSFLIGLTATPSKQTLGFFSQNLVMEYSHERAVADGVNVGYDVYRIKTEVGEQGSRVEKGFYIDKRNRQTRKVRWSKLDDDLTYDPAQLDRSVVSPSQIRTVIRAFKETVLTEMFPGRTEVPKTLFFAKDDSHAEDIVEILRDEFGKGNDFCKKITYKTTGEKPEDLIASFRNSYNPRIAVTVDMISTGTDIKPIECVVFMRDVKSRVLFEQMKGRGTRTINIDDLRGVTPDAPVKSRFIIVDAIGICESDKTDSRPLERQPKVSFEKLLLNIAIGNHTKDNLSSLAGRLARLDRELNPADRKEIEKIGAKPLKTVINELLDAIDPDKIAEKILTDFKTDVPDKEQLATARKALMETSCHIFENPKFRETVIRIKKQNEQIIDTITVDRVVSAGFDEAAKEKAKTVVNTFKQFIEDNKNELTALQIIYSKAYAKRHLTYQEIKDLAEAIKRPPYGLSQEMVWHAYEQLEQSRVKKAGPQKLLTDIISLVRFTLGQEAELEPFELSVEEKFTSWLAESAKAGVRFTPPQIEWLALIKSHIAASGRMAVEDFELSPFYEKGGAVKFYGLFGDKAQNVLEQLNTRLID